MKKNNRGESLTSIIVGIIILSIAILSVTNMLIYSNNEIKVFRELREINNLKYNLKNIVANVDTSGLLENEIFYIYKNDSNSNFEVFTGSSNSQYKYIDKFGNKVDPTSYGGEIFSRFLWIEREDDGLLDDQNQIIKVSLTKLIKK